LFSSQPQQSTTQGIGYGLNEVSQTIFETDVAPGAEYVPQEASMNERSINIPISQHLMTHYPQNTDLTFQPAQQIVNPSNYEPIPGPSNTFELRLDLDAISQYGKICTVCKRKFEKPQIRRNYGAVLCKICQSVARKYRKKTETHDLSKCETSRKDENGCGINEMMCLYCKFTTMKKYGILEIKKYSDAIKSIGYVHF